MSEDISFTITPPDSPGQSDNLDDTTRENNFLENGKRFTL